MKSPHDNNKKRCQFFHCETNKEWSYFIFFSYLNYCAYQELGIIEAAFAHASTALGSSWSRTDPPPEVMPAIVSHSCVFLTTVDQGYRVGHEDSSVPVWSITATGHSSVSGKRQHDVLELTKKPTINDFPSRSRSWNGFRNWAQSALVLVLLFI